MTSLDGPGGSGPSRSDLRDARVLATTEIRAQLRRIRGEPRQVVGLVVMAVLFGPGVGAALLLPAIDLGAGLASATPPVGVVGALLSAVAVAGAYLGGSAAITQARVGAIGSLVRTSISPRAVALGRFTSEMVQTTAFVVPIAAFLLAAVAWGAGGPLAPLLLFLASVPVFGLCTLAGRLIGTALRRVDQRLGLSLWVKGVAFLGLFGATMIGVQYGIESLFEGSGDAFAPSIPAVLPGTPIQAYASVFLAPLGAPVGPLGLGIAVAVVASVPAVLVATVRAETALLLREESGDTATAANESRETPFPFDRTPAGRVAWRYLVRTGRNPRMLSHLLPVAFGGLGMIGSVATNPELLLAFGPGGATILGGVLAGATYCLNPMGDDRDQLPLILTSARSTAVMLRGRVLAGTAIGLAVAAGIGVPLSVLAGAPARLLRPLAFGPPFVLAAAGTALGFGALVPKFERREYVNVERAHPSMLAVLGYGFGTLVAGIVGLVLLGTTVGGATSLWLVAGWLGYGLVVGGTGVGGYLFAVRKFDRLTLDDV